MNQPTVKTLLFHWYLLGVIKAPNELTSVAQWLGVDLFFSRRPEDRIPLIPFLLTELFLATERRTRLDAFIVWEVSNRIEENLDEEEQKNLLLYLRTRIIPLTKK